MRYINEYDIETLNINDSLVFYRSLFDRMPDKLNSMEIHFWLQDFSLKVKETNQVLAKKEVMFFPLEREVVMSAYRRMERFLGKEKWMENCERLGDAFGIEDPDGNKWKIGNPKSSVQFEKCYY